eukprot:GHVP01055452.1.p1 GENE.GHVP01055452.1~~GHVP01055452.1.p1  ORF type:complete len:208 (-),score=40.86 GHVP01055452.1:900-1523(-)
MEKEKWNLIKLSKKQQIENSVHLLAHLFQFSRYSHKSPIVLAIDTLEPPGTWTLKHSDVGVTSRRISNDIFTQRTEELAQRIAAVRKFVSCIIIKEVFLLYSIEEWHTTCEVTTGEENTPIGFDASFQFPVKIPNAEVSNVSSKRPIGIFTSKSSLGNIQHFEGSTSNEELSFLSYMHASPVDKKFDIPVGLKLQTPEESFYGKFCF